MDILRFITAGNVDDGKSTLIGRLLYDSKSILSDQLENLKNSSGNNGDGNIDLARLTDGLRAEREQGITIDVAYKYFSTPKRKFIIADSPGHIQYTRNMVTGASGSNLAIILVDARHGVTEQTKRHSIISSLVGIEHLVICINKMDLVDFSEEIYTSIKNDFESFAQKLDALKLHFIPISALLGDNIVERSSNMPWYDGKSLLHFLEDVEVKSQFNYELPRLAVQTVIRPKNNDLHDYRGYAGKIISGVFKKGDKISALPSGFNSVIKSININDVELIEAAAPLSVTVQLEDDIDISRGDIIAGIENHPHSQKEINAVLCWMDTKKLNSGSRYLFQYQSKVVKCVVAEIKSRINVDDYSEISSVDSAVLNDIVKVKIKTASPVYLDEYKKNKSNGSFILVDEFTNATAAGGMVI